MITAKVTNKADGQSLRSAGLMIELALYQILSRLTALCENSAAENGEPQLHKKRGRLTTLSVINEARTEILAPKTRRYFLEVFRR